MNEVSALPILGERSEKNLIGVRSGLIRVVRRCVMISPFSFVVIEGLRSEAKQREYLETGKSRTLNSRHLTGDAVDLAVMVGGTIVWEPWQLYERLARAMFQAAHIEEEVIEWGGHFARFQHGELIPFLDGVHFQLPYDPPATVTRATPAPKTAKPKPKRKAPIRRTKKAT